MQKIKNNGAICDNQNEANLHTKGVTQLRAFKTEQDFFLDHQSIYIFVNVHDLAKDYNYTHKTIAGSTDSWNRVRRLSPKRLCWTLVLESALTLTVESGFDSHSRVTWPLYVQSSDSFIGVNILDILGSLTLPVPAVGRLPTTPPTSTLAQHCVIPIFSVGLFIPKHIPVCMILVALTWLAIKQTGQIWI